jgi:hypothetical protein
MGIKTCDLQAVPLCPRHHAEWHQSSKVAPYDHEGTLRELWEAVATTLRAAILSGQFTAEEAIPL